ncbi:MAG: zf-HC2 domain-containing protein [Verrucomicrobia bacterium]|nr:zf-HC2 domain-containing protein [Verrucomicrobiota bacterium]
MKHPTREEWMSFLYDELPKAAKTDFQRHLDSCSACQKSVAEWESAMSGLDAWKLPNRSASISWAQPAFKWAIAAVFAFGLGYGIGRFSVPAANLEALRAGIEESLRTSVQNRLAAQIEQTLVDDLKASWAAEKQQLIDRMDALAAQTLTASAEQTEELLSNYREAFQRFETRLTRQADELATLRRDTETMAVLAEYGFRLNEQQLVRLASFNTPPRRVSGGSRTQDEP